MKTGPRLLLGIFLFTAACAMPTCTKDQGGVAKVVARGTIDAALALCVAEHEWMVENDLAKVCAIADDMMPIVRDLLSAHKRGAMLAAAAHKDGG